MASVRILETDITIFGATSFTAKHVIEYLCEASKVDFPAGRSLKMTFAGRNREKLEAVKESVPASDTYSIDILVAEADDEKAMTRLVSRTQVVLTCAGPFSKYGTKLMEACCRGGADYVDITGEVDWAGSMREKYGSLNEKSGSRIISFCGYDSVPSDLSVYLAVEALRKEVGSKVQVSSATSYHTAFSGFNGGTIQTMLTMPISLKNMFFTKDFQMRDVPFFANDPLHLTHPKKVKDDRSFAEMKSACAWREWTNQLVTCDPILNYGASFPFFMGVINTKVVNASAVSLKYGKSFTYGERTYLGKSLSLLLSVVTLLPALILSVLTSVVGLIMMLPLIGPLIGLLFPSGSGPSDFVCKLGFASVLTEVESEPQKGLMDKAYCELHFSGDPSNRVTAQCVCEAALCLILNRKSLPPKSSDGFGSPAETLGPVLAERLVSTKVRKVEKITKVLKGVRPQVVDKIVSTIVGYALVSFLAWKIYVVMEPHIIVFWVELVGAITAVIAFLEYEINGPTGKIFADIGKGLYNFVAGIIGYIFGEVTGLFGSIRDQVQGDDVKTYH